MSRRKPASPGPSRRGLIRAIGLGLPAVAACASATNPPPPDGFAETGGSGTTGDSGGGDTATPGDTVDTGPSVVADTRPADPTEDWPGKGPADPSAFPLGMQLGEPTASSLVVWAYAPGAKEVTVHWASWDGTAWVDGGSASATPSAEGYVHHTLEGLQPDEIVAVQAEAGGLTSSVAQGRTAPHPDSLPEVYLGATSCLDQVHGEFPSLDEVKAIGQLDAMLWLGDTVYADGNRTLEEYRALWREQLGKGSFQRLFARVPGIWTWDDHEVGNNWNPQTIDPDHLDVATTTFHETVALPDGVRSTRKLWRSLRFGRTVELFVLDCRGERDYDAGHYISPEQLQWLQDGLAASECVWKVVATSVPITDMPQLWDLGGAQEDRWDGFPGTQRAELLAHIRQQGLTGVFFVAGDLHQSTVSYVDLPGGDGDDLLEIMAGPGGSVRNTIGRTIKDDQFVFKEADWSAARLSFHPGGTARLQVAFEEGGPLMLDMTIDDRGNVVRIDQERHPWLEDDT